MTPFDRWLTTQPTPHQHGRPTDCYVCETEGYTFTYHATDDPHYRCDNCGAYYYLNEVG